MDIITHNTQFGSMLASPRNALFYSPDDNNRIWEGSGSKFFFFSIIWNFLFFWTFDIILRRPMIQHGWNILLWNEWRERGGKDFLVGHSGIIRQHRIIHTHTHISPRSYSFPFIRITCKGSVCAVPSRDAKWEGREKKKYKSLEEKIKKKQQQNQTAATLPTPGSRSGFFFLFSTFQMSNCYQMLRWLH